MTQIVAGGYAEQGVEGLYSLTLSLAPDALVSGGPVAPLVNVSAGVPISEGGWYFADEGAGEVCLSAGRTDSWRTLAHFGSGGEAPCHLALSSDGGLLAIANYESGTTALFTVDRNTGLPQGTPSIWQHQGRGPVADRQDGPHAHWVGFAPNGRLYVCDLGADAVLAFAAGAALGEPSTAFTAPPGSGPRQLAFHPIRPFAFLVSELAATLTLLRVEESGHLTPVQIVATARPGAPSDNLGGAIALSAVGDRVYVTNRGDDSVAAYAVEDAELRLLGHAPTGGTSPRFLLLLEEERRLLVAHENTGGVTVLPLAADGEPCPSIARADIPGAAFLARIGE